MVLWCVFRWQLFGRWFPWQLYLHLQCDRQRPALQPLREMQRKWNIYGTTSDVKLVTSLQRRGSNDPLVVRNELTEGVKQRRSLKTLKMEKCSYFNELVLVLAVSGLDIDIEMTTVVMFHLRVTPASSPTWTGPQKGNTSCPTRATMKFCTVSCRNYLIFQSPSSLSGSSREVTSWFWSHQGTLQQGANCWGTGSRAGTGSGPPTPACWAFTSWVGGEKRSVQVPPGGSPGSDWWPLWPARVPGVWLEGSDGTDINALCRSHSQTVVAVADDFCKVHLFQYPCPKPKVPSAPLISRLHHQSHVFSERKFNLIACCLFFFNGSICYQKF